MVNCAVSKEAVHCFLRLLENVEKDFQFCQEVEFHPRLRYVQQNNSSTCPLELCLEQNKFVKAGAVDTPEAGAVQDDFRFSIREATLRSRSEPQIVRPQSEMAGQAEDQNALALTLVYFHIVGAGKCTSAAARSEGPEFRS